MTTRKYWLDLMLRIAEPVLTALEERRLESDFPTDFRPSRSPYRCLEAFGRTMCGIAPWLELEGLIGEEGEARSRLRRKARAAIAAATDPDSPDFLNFCRGGQPLVDAAFLAHGIIRAPRELWAKLDPAAQANLAAALKSSRSITPCDNNWLLFSAMVEAALSLMGETVEFDKVDRAVSRFAEEWYAGDGTYGDGPQFHWDYYNSFVIQPMYIDVLRTFGERYGNLLPEALRRAQRYAAVQERMIAPDGTYIVVGRSVCYRFGAFQHLAQAVLQGFLPEGLAPAQVRCALTAVLRRCDDGKMIGDDGWLVPGVLGHQPSLAEDYINRGSLYLCSAVFLPLGLAPDDPFWAGEDEPWTQRRIWSGENLPCDHALY